MDELIQTIQTLAMAYLTESDDGDDVEETTFPISIVRFVVEYACQQCNFPKSFSQARKVQELSECQNSIAMACVDVYLKIGAEGQASYSSNGVTRNFKYEWINTGLIDRLPNYVRTV